MLTKRRARSLINDAKWFRLTRGVGLYEMSESGAKGFIRYKGYDVFYDLTPKGAVARITSIHEARAQS